MNNDDEGTKRAMLGRAGKKQARCAKIRKAKHDSFLAGNRVMVPTYLCLCYDVL